MKEKLLINLVWLLPKSVIYWCTIRVFAIANTTTFSNRTPDSINVFEALSCIK